jgi:hypothetical protein
MRKTGFGLDERNRAVLGKICTILYIFTIYFLLGDILYRQLVLHQNTRQFEDIAVLMTGNVLIFIALMLYFGGVPVGRFSFRKLIAGYLAFLALGMTFTMIKYREHPDSFLFDKAVVVFTICTFMVAAAVMIGYLGNRRINREIE